jgi:hypothetical protein
MAKPITPPLAKSSAPVAPTWDDVEPQAPAEGRDALGFSLEDRAALGLSERDVEMTHFHTGDAHDALLAVLQQGGAIGKSPPKRKAR